MYAPGCSRQHGARWQRPGNNCRPYDPSTSQIQQKDCGTSSPQTIRHLEGWVRACLLAWRDSHALLNKESKRKRQTRDYIVVTKPSLPLAQIELIKLEKTVESFTPNHLLFHICWMWVWSSEQADTEVRALGRMSGMEMCMDWEPWCTCGKWHQQLGQYVRV